ncbi:MAG: hypothetical protein ABIP94_20780 [Planctomycetota bacterium]
MTSPLARRDFARAAVLAATTVGIWMFARMLWLKVARQSPPEYDVDALETLARIKLVGEMGWSFFVDKTMPRLGAPYGADWSSYPMPDGPVFLLLGLLAKIFGMIAVGHIAILLAHLLNALTFYFCSRTLGHRAPFAGCAALLFAFSHFNISRGLSHYSFTLSFTVPAIILVVWMVGSSRRLLQRKRWHLFCLATAAITATGSPYYGVMFAMLLVVALSYQILSDRRKSNIFAGSSCLIVWALVVGACNYSSIEVMLRSGSEVMVRNYSSTELYGLRPIEWITPPPYHRFSGAALLTQNYARTTMFEGEHVFSYLGVIGIVGLAMITIRLLRALFRRQAGYRPAHALTICFVVAFGIVGGLNSLVALTVTEVFRAGNRYTVFVLAISLYALAAWASVKWRRLDVVAAYTIAAALVCVGLWDQLRPILTELQLAEHAKAPMMDQQLGRELESRLSPGAMVFQLPAVPFLEQKAIVGMTDYQHFRPYLFTSSLRFSYGALANDRAMVWQRRVAKMPAAEMRAELESAGFSAVEICRSAYLDGALALRRSFEAAGMRVICEMWPHTVFGLTPSDSPHLPALIGPNRLEAWDAVAWNANRLAILEGAGWFVPESSGTSSWRWAGKDATCVLWNPTGAAQKVRVHCNVMGLRKHSLSVVLTGGRELWRGQIALVGIPCEFQLELLPGETELRWIYDGPPVRPSPADRRLLGFRVNDLVVEER